jgi:hypothetical protein
MSWAQQSHRPPNHLYLVARDPASSFVVAASRSNSHRIFSGNFSARRHIHISTLSDQKNLHWL